jgi:TrmH family RNA methyltransferase
MASENQRISRENATFQEIYSLSINRNKRFKTGLFIVEGVRPINLCIENNWKIETLIVNNDNKNLSDWAVNVINSLKNTKTAIYWMDGNLYRKLSSKEESHEILLVVRQKYDRLDISFLKENFKLLVLDRPQNHGNLGTIIRSADAFGIDAIVVTGHAIDIYDPKVIASSTGSFFTLPVVVYPDQTEFFTLLDALKEQSPDLAVLSADEKGEVNLPDYEVKSPICILAGNEKWGLNKAMLEKSDTVLSIKMVGGASSLNVSNAVSIILYELSKKSISK